MAASLEEIFISVWRQALVEEAKSVTLDNRDFPVRRISRSRLREVDFQFEGHELRGLEQNPETGSRWAKLPQAAQLTIKAATEKIRALLLTDFVTQGFTIDSEVAGTQLQLSKPVGETDVVSPGRFLHDSMIGQGVGGHNRNCRRMHRVIFLPDGESTALTMQWESSCEVQAGFGARSTDRHWTETDKKKITWMQDELESVKQRAEK